MDPAFNHKMDLDVPDNFDYDPTLMHKFEGIRYDTPADFDMCMPDVPVYETYHPKFPGPTTPESSTHHLDQNDNMPILALRKQDKAMKHDRVKIEEADETPSDWRSLMDFNIPDYTQISLTNISQIQALYADYLRTYENQSATNATRIRYAKALFFALLTHYYPTSQAYTIAPYSPGPIAKTGLSFILAAPDGSDIWKDMPAKKPTKQRKRPYTPQELETMKEKDPIAAYEHGVGWACNIQWQRIKPEDIASFVLFRKLRILNQESGVWKWEWKTHTYLFILIGDFDDKRLSTENTTHRSDVLTEALCRGRRVKEGYGMLMYGA